MLQSDLRAFLVLFLGDFDPSGDTIGVIEWLRCHGAVLGGPNDEAIMGHRLWDHGLSDVLWSGEVKHSTWIAHWEAVNRVHAYHRPESYAELRHVILPLKDSTFECLANGFAVSTTSELLDVVLNRLLPRLVVP